MDLLLLLLLLGDMSRTWSKQGWHCRFTECLLKKAPT
jgi:hypothetical protein